MGIADAATSFIAGLVSRRAVQPAREKKSKLKSKKHDVDDWDHPEYDVPMDVSDRKDPKEPKKRRVKAAPKNNNGVQQPVREMVKVYQCKGKNIMHSGGSKVYAKHDSVEDAHRALARAGIGRVPGRKNVRTDGESFYHIKEGQLDELSARKLVKYEQDAMHDFSTRRMDRKSSKRLDGYNLALDKLNKRAKVNAKEETELNELSQRRLKRYIGKAGRDAISRTKNAGMIDKLSDRKFTADYQTNKAKKRIDGIRLARKKIISEVSLELMKSWKSKVMDKARDPKSNMTNARSLMISKIAKKIARHPDNKNKFRG